MRTNMKEDTPFHIQDKFQHLLHFTYGRTHQEKMCGPVERPGESELGRQLLRLLLAVLDRPEDTKYSPQCEARSDSTTIRIPQDRS